MIKIFRQEAAPPLVAWFSCRFSIPAKLEFGDVSFCGGRKTGEPGEKPSEQGKLNPHVTPDRNRTRATKVEGGRSHHCALPAPTIEYKDGNKTTFFRVRAHFPAARFPLHKQCKDVRKKAKAWSHRINRLNLLHYTYQPDDKRRR